MKIKDSDSIAKAFASRFEGKEIPETLLIKDGGVPLFTKEQINETPDMLDKLLRSILVDNNITKEYFSERAKAYAFSIGIHQTKVGNYKSNILKTLKKGKITYRKFEEIVHYILGYPIEHLNIGLIKDKQLKSYNLDRGDHK
jgi:hypothetical protein